MVKYETVKLATGADLPLFGLGTWLVSLSIFKNKHIFKMDELNQNGERSILIRSLFM